MLWDRVRQIGVGASAVAIASSLIVGCTPSRNVTDDEPRPVAARDSGGFYSLGGTQLYARMGLLAQDGPVPFVGNIGYLASRSPDSTLVVVTLSLANRALTFVRESDRYRATYDVQIDLHQGATLVRHLEGHETVRVASYKETTRNDESVIYRAAGAVRHGDRDSRRGERAQRQGRSGRRRAALRRERAVQPTAHLRGHAAHESGLVAARRGQPTRDIRLRPRLGRERLPRGIWRRYAAAGRALGARR
jgi:hypothetical protein